MTAAGTTTDTEAGRVTAWPGWPVGHTAGDEPPPASGPLDPAVDPAVDPAGRAGEGGEHAGAARPPGAEPDAARPATLVSLRVTRVAEPAFTAAAASGPATDAGGAGPRHLLTAAQERGGAADCPTTPMVRRAPRIPPTPPGLALVGPAGAGLGALGTPACAVRGSGLRRTALASWRRATRRRAARAGSRPTAGSAAADRGPAGVGPALGAAGWLPPSATTMPSPAATPTPATPWDLASASDRTHTWDPTIAGSVSPAAPDGPTAAAAAQAAVDGQGDAAARTTPADRTAALASLAATAPAIALLVGSVSTALAGLALLAAHGQFGPGWSGRAWFVASALATTSACLLARRSRPLLRRFRGRDELTGLVGRRAFLDVATRVVGGGEHRVREADPAALVLIDLDRFREINGILGHESGDRLLAVVADRLRALLHPSDLAARIGGDEFAVLLRDAGPGRAELLAGLLRDALRSPVVLADIPVQTEVSVGIAYAPAHGRSAAELLRHAEAAMYEAKRTRVGQRTYQRGRHAPTSPGRARLRLRAELRGALEQDQIELRYQPKADPRTGRVSGLEALVRWQHPREGLRGPSVFLPEMEQAGLMPQLTRRVLDLALADCASWHAAGAALSVSVNVPPSMLGDAGFVELVSEALRRNRLAPHALVVEVTEEAVITAREQARRTLADLRGLGVRVSLDDYGTGFCSLAYLRELPADEVKLDQLFLRDLHRDPSAAEIVRSTVSLAHALDLRIVAEGVETKAAWLALAGWRCDEVQGYFISPPLAAGRVVGWLEDWARRVSRQGQAAGTQPGLAVAPAGPGLGAGRPLELPADPVPIRAGGGEPDDPRARAQEPCPPPRGLAVAMTSGLAASPLVPAQHAARAGQLSLPRAASGVHSVPCTAARPAEPARPGQRPGG